MPYGWVVYTEALPRPYHVNATKQAYLHTIPVSE